MSRNRHRDPDSDPAEVAEDETSVSYVFGPFRLDPAQGLLFRGGDVVPLTPKVFDTLQVLVEHPERLLTKDELLAAIWPDTVVEEANLSQNVFVLRKALGETAGGPYIETYPRRGYRFAVPVEIERGSVDSTTAGATERAAGRTAAPAVRLASGAILALVVAVVAWGVVSNLQTGSQRPRLPRPSTIRSLAVLPFKPLGTERDAALELGMADALITRLGNLRAVSVRPTGAVATFAGKEIDPLTAGRDLAVDSLLDGRVQRADGRLRVTVQLLSTADGSTLWGQAFDERFADIFAVQDSISSQVAAALVTVLSDEERSALERHPTDSVEAYELYLEGLYHAVQLANFDRAAEALEAAIDLDPEFARAWSGLAFAASQTVDLVSPPNEAQPRARRAALEALALDPGDAEARFVLANVLFQYDWDPETAEAEFRRAIELDPDDPRIHGYYGFMLALLGRFGESEAEVERGVELDPGHFEPYVNACVTAYLRRDVEVSLARCRRLVSLQPEFWLGRVLLGRALEQAGRTEEALAEVRRARELDEASTEPWMDLGRLLVRTGEENEARRLLADLLARSEDRYVAPFHVAMVYAALGDRDQAFAWLEKAFEARSWYLTWLATAPELDPLREDPRFKDLERRVGL